MKILSIYEKKGSKQELDKRRSLLIIDIISKIFGENHKDQTHIEVTCSPYSAEESQVKVEFAVLTQSKTSLIFIFFVDYGSSLIRCDSGTLFKVNKSK